MNFAEITGISFAVSIDAVAVSIGGALCANENRKLRNAGFAALFFGGFQTAMPLAGYFCAAWAADYFGRFAHFTGFLLLAFAGAKMILDGIKSGSDDEKNVCKLGVTDFFAPRNLFLPAIATSIDALTIGAGFALNKVSIAVPAVSMGVVTALASFAAVIAGTRLKKLAGKKAMLIAGGVILIGIGLKILLYN